MHKQIWSHKKYAEKLRQILKCTKSACLPLIRWGQSTLPPSLMRVPMGWIVIGTCDNLAMRHTQGERVVFLVSAT